MRSQIYYGNKVNTSTFRQNNQSWVVTNSPNCFVYAINGGFDKPKFIEDISSSSTFFEKPHEYSENLIYKPIEKDKIWIYHQNINNNHECTESVAIIDEKFSNNSIGNSIKIANKILKNINDFEINENLKVIEIKDMFECSNSKKWIDTLLTIIKRIDIFKYKICDTTNYLKRVTNQV